MKSKKGSLTIEASIALTAFMFLIITVLSFSMIYKAQSIVSHATLQTSQSLAIESYYRETISKVGTANMISNLIKFADVLGFDSANGLDDGYQSLGASGTDFHKIVKKTFIHALAANETEADSLLEDARIVDGIDGIDLSYSSVKGGDIIIRAEYKVKLPFSYFGDLELELSKTAKTKAFKKIDDDNGYQETTTTEE